MGQTTQPLAQPVPVPQTGSAISTNYSDIAMTNLFISYVHLINSERQAIWQRYQAMLLGNSIILGLVVRTGGISSHELIAATVLGLALCTAWLVMTKSRWKLFRM
jgi:hypothetical protein